jgi:hypothetical protein
MSHAIKQQLLVLLLLLRHLRSAHPPIMHVILTLLSAYSRANWENIVHGVLLLVLAVTRLPTAVGHDVYFLFLLLAIHIMPVNPPHLMLRCFAAHLFRSSSPLRRPKRP